MNEKLIEATARAICGKRGYDFNYIAQDKTCRAYSVLTTEAHAVLAALQSAGYAVVPVEPTEEMLKAGRARVRYKIKVPDWMHPHGYAPAYAYYRAMIEATKNPPQREPELAEGD